MIFLIGIYVAAGLLFYFLVLLAFSFTAFGGNPGTVRNPTLRALYPWIIPGDILKNILGIPAWILLWPISLLAMLITQPKN